MKKHKCLYTWLKGLPSAQGQTLLVKGALQSGLLSQTVIGTRNFQTGTQASTSFLFSQVPSVSARRWPLAHSPPCWGPSDPFLLPTSLPAPTDPLSFTPPTTSWCFLTSTSRRSTTCARSTLRATLTGQLHSFISVYSYILILRVPFDRFNVFFSWHSWLTSALHWLQKFTQSHVSEL